MNCEDCGKPMEYIAADPGDATTPPDEAHFWCDNCGISMPLEMIVCDACSRAGGADRAVYHGPPACSDCRVDGGTRADNSKDNQDYRP
jgi:hypothetical protein